MSCTRRTFLEYVSMIAAAGCTFSHGRVSEDGDSDGDGKADSPESDAIDMAVFPFGVMAGDMEATALATRAIVWTRCTQSECTLVVWVKATNETVFAGAVSVVDGFVHHDVSSLLPATRYRYQFRSGTSASLAGELVTPPAPGTRPLFTFGAVSCTHQAGAAGYRAISHAADEQLDCFFHLGDHVYNDADHWLTTLAEFRASWADCFAAADMRGFHGSHGVYFTWDDHEVINNWDWDWVDANPQYRPSVVNGTQTYFEHHPIRRNIAAPNRLWRSVRWGDTAELFILDLRSERREDIGRRMMSRAQLQWLLDGLASSPAVFKLIMNPIPVCTMPAEDAHVADRWEGFATQRDELLGFIRDRNLRNVWWISGDYHVGAVGQLERYGYRWYGMREIMMGPGAGHGAAEAQSMAAHRDTTSGEAQWSFVTDASNYVTITADPDAQTLRVRFRGGDGTILHDATYGPDDLPPRAMSGDIAAKHMQLQAQLGRPLTNAHATQDSVGSWQQFEYGYIFRHPTTGAHAVRGRILDTWAAAGWSQSSFGYPMGEAYTTATGELEQEFQLGYITYDELTGVVRTRFKA